MGVLCILVLARMSVLNNFAARVVMFESLGGSGVVKSMTEKIIERASIRIGLSAGQRVRDQRERHSSIHHRPCSATDHPSWRVVEQR